MKSSYLSLRRVLQATTSTWSKLLAKQVLRQRQEPVFPILLNKSLQGQKLHWLLQVYKLGNI
jgi:hypothetical protein